MSAPALTINHGGAALLLLSARTRRRRDELYTGEYEFDSDVKLDPALAIGAGVPGYSGMIIKEVEVEEDGGSYNHRVSATGVDGPRPERRIFTRPRFTTEGFDEGTEQWITTNPLKLVPGSRMNGYGNMVCIDADPEQLDDSSYYRVTGTFKGLARNKTTARKVSANAEVIEKDNYVQLGSGGWSTPQKSRIQWPNTVAIFSYVTTYIPTIYIPQQGGSPIGGGSFPGVMNITFTTNDTVTYNWPNGWRRISMEQDTIPGTTITLTSEVWEYCQKIKY